MTFWIVAFQTLALLTILGVVLVNVFAVRNLRDQPRPSTRPRVSLLIPARNEARNVEAAVTCAMAQDYPDLEVLVLDDESQDGTGDSIGRLQRRFPGLRGYPGDPLPQGWLGKPHACHQLSRQATGDVLFFMDCDVRPAPDAVDRTVGYMGAEQLDFVSVFPHQQTRTLSEKLAVPLISLVLYGFLPFPWIRCSTLVAFSAASGQWMAIRADAYERIGGHAAVRQQVLEDIELTRNVRRHGLKMDLLSGLGIICCRMYRGNREVVDGFSKNAFASARYNLLSFCAFLLFVAVVFLLPFVLPAGQLGWVPIALIIVIKTILALRFRQEMTGFVLLHPISIAYGLFIGLNSIFWHYTGQGHWKGRPI